jgi:succinoglycan biosynthesis protein ExoA
MSADVVQVSIIIPCFNEEHHLQACIESIQDEFTRRNSEILVVDGDSDDDTVRVAERLKHIHPNIVVLRNPDRFQSAALNVGIRHSRGQVLVRVDAHSSYPPHYVQRCVELLDRTGADNVGGVMSPVGDSLFQRALSAAMRHPVGVGNAHFHLGNHSGFVDTVYLGTFRKATVSQIGGFDPIARTNEDAEMNIRIQAVGGRIYLDKSLVVTYRPRKSLTALGKQYFHYGVGRAYTVIKHRKISSRQLASPLVVSVLALSLFLTPWFIYSLLMPCAYIASMLAISALARGVRGWRERVVLTTIFCTIHICWGIGFLTRASKAWLGVQPVKRWQGPQNFSPHPRQSA